MTSQFDFTNNEWSDIATLPILAGYAIARAADSGRVGTFIEIRTLGQHIRAKAPDNAARSLIEAVSTTDVRTRVDEFEDHSPELLADVTVKAAEEMSKVLDDKADHDESTAYKQWVFDIAYEVADAAKEDGVRISEAEAVLLGRLREALAL